MSISVTLFYMLISIGSFYNAVFFFIRATAYFTIILIFVQNYIFFFSPTIPIYRDSAFLIMNYKL